MSVQDDKTRAEREQKASDASRTAEQAKEASHKTEQPAERLMHDALSIGRSWAEYGLNLGSSTLEVTANTLQKTARILSDLTTEIAEKKAKLHAEKEGAPATPEASKKS